MFGGELGLVLECVSVILNVVDFVRFMLDVMKWKKGCRMVVVMLRLMYRKGVYLLAGVISFACVEYDDLDFLIVGDGLMWKYLEKVIEDVGLIECVIIFGSVLYDKVLEVFRRGDVFFNVSFTESFCIVVFEVVLCGCFVVVIVVGGVLEVLLEDIMFLVKLDV